MNTALDPRFETITCQGREIPIAAALNRDGRPIPVIGDLAPSQCNHAGATWSDNLALRCPRCRAPMFLPPRFLAHKTEDRIAAMYDLWRAAGCPPWYGRSVDHPEGHWGIVPRFWRIAQAQGFDDLGGLPVNLKKWDAFVIVRAEFELA